MTTNRPKFQRAERKRVKLKLAITGPSGSGKTFSALELATGIAGPEGKIAFIDTENDSASLYSDRFVFDTLNIDPPYTIAKYIEAMKSAEAEKYDVVVVDSLSHAWAGEGGILAKKSALDARGGNSFTNWGQLTPEQEKLVSTMLNLGIHLVGTLRSKQEYLVELNDKGKSAPRKVGLAPIQRDGMEYEFTTVFDVAMDHKAATSKDRTGLFDGVIETITKETGEKLMAWLGGASPEAKPSPKVESPSTETPPNAITVPQRNRLFAIANSVKIPDEEVIKILRSFGYSSSKEIEWENYNKIVKQVQEYKAPEAEPSLSEEEMPY